MLSIHSNNSSHVVRKGEYLLKPSSCEYYVINVNNVWIKQGQHLIVLGYITVIDNWKKQISDSNFHSIVLVMSAINTND